MTDILSMLQVVLQEAGFRTASVSLDDKLTSYFEDDDVIGFAYVFNDVTSLLNRWQSVEMALLTKYASHLQMAGDKAWNVYCAFLSSGEASPTEQHQLDKIEENQERTRKIAAAGIAGREELVEALLPVLPLQHHAIIATEYLTERLRKHLVAIAPIAADAVLEQKISPAEVARLLGTPS